MMRTEKTEHEQVDFFKQCYSKFLAAEPATESVQRYYLIAGTTVCLRFAGQSMVPLLTPALEHLKTSACTLPDLTLCIWDSESTGVNMAPPPCNRRCFTDRGDIWGFNSRRIKSAFHWIENSVNLMDLQNDIGIFWVQTIESLPFWVYASPLRTLFHWWMEKNGCQLLHAAAVGTEHGAVLITGKGGVGKSTTALTCLKAGFYYAADDYLIVSIDLGPMVYSLYNTAKLNADDIPNFHNYHRLISNPQKLDQEKAVIFLYPQLKEQIRTAMPVKAILTPNITDQAMTSISPTHYWSIQRAISFTTMSQLPGVGRQTHDFINAFCSRLPVFQLSLGSDLEDIPLKINAFIKSSPSGQHKVPPASFSSQQKPLVSVIIPVFNGERFIAKAIANVCSQNYPALEIIVVDDGSSDGTGKIVEQADVDIRYFRQDNDGPASARNRGLKDASGEFILFLDVDDFWPENNINLLVDHMLREEDMDVVRGYAQLVLQNNDSPEMVFSGNPKESFADYIGAAIYRKSVFNKVGLFDTSLLFGEDSDWFTRAKELHVRMKRLEEVTLYVRRHGANMTEGKSLVELNMLHVFKKALDRRRAAQNEPSE
jgi:hypothetical protein